MDNSRSSRSLGWRYAVAGVAFAALALVSSRPAAAANSVPLPFLEGEAVRIVQGYNGGSHQGDSHLGLDLVLANGQTTGATVISPVEGTIAWAFEPGDRTGCLQVNETGDKYGVRLCHVQLDRPYKRGERIVRGQPLGIVGGPGEVGNNGLPHVHMELRGTGGGSSTLPFGGPDGLPLGGVDFPASGVPNEHAMAPVLISTNSISFPPAEAASVTPQRWEQPVPVVRGCAPGEQPRFVLGFAALKAQVGEAVGDALTCEFPDPSASGDVHQQTSRGLAVWTKRTGLASFTNGSETWRLTPNGLEYWVGDGVQAPQPDTTAETGAQGG